MGSFSEARTQLALARFCHSPYKDIFIYAIETVRSARFVAVARS